MGLRDKILRKPPEEPALPPVHANGYAPRYNVPANPGARNLPLPGAAPAPPSDGTPKPSWSKIGNGYERFKLRRNDGAIPPVAPAAAAPAPGADGYGYGYGDGTLGGYGVPARGAAGYGDSSGYPGGGYGVPPGSGQYSTPSVDGRHGGVSAGTGRAGGDHSKTAQEELEEEYGATPGHAGEDLEQEQAQAVERTESDEEVELTKQQMRFTKQESLSSTRNALRLAHEAEATAMNSMMRLGDQSEKLADTERNLDLSKAHAHRADDNAREIEKLNSSIFRPHITINKSSKRAAEEARVINRYVDEREERERTRDEVIKSQRRVDDSIGGPGSSSRFGAAKFAFGKARGGLNGRPEDPQATKLAQRARYQFEASASDDELEDELENNLDDIGHVAKGLNRLGRAMGSEIEDQNARLARLSDKTSNLDTKVYTSTYRLEHLRH